MYNKVASENEKTWCKKVKKKKKATNWNLFYNICQNKVYTRKTL